MTYGYITPYRKPAKLRNNDGKGIVDRKTRQSAGNAANLLDDEFTYVTENA